MFIASCSACTFVLAYNSIWFCRSCISLRSRGTRERILISFNRREKLRFFCEDCKLAAVLLRFFQGLWVSFSCTSIQARSACWVPWAPEVFLSCGQRPRPRAAKPREKALARSGAFYRPRWPLSFFIGLHLCQSDCSVCPSGGRWEPISRLAQSLDQLI